MVYNPTVISTPTDDDTIDISYYDGAATTSATRDVTAVGVTPAQRNAVSSRA